MATVSETLKVDVAILFAVNKCSELNKRKGQMLSYLIGPKKWECYLVVTQWEIYQQLILMNDV